MNLFLKMIPGRKNRKTFLLNRLRAIFTPTDATSASNCSTRSPSIPSYNGAGQNHDKNLSPAWGGSIRFD